MLKEREFLFCANEGQGEEPACCWGTHDRERRVWLDELEKGRRLLEDPEVGVWVVTSSMASTSCRGTALITFSWDNEEGSGGCDYEDLIFSYSHMVRPSENVTCVGSR